MGALSPSAMVNAPSSGTGSPASSARESVGAPTGSTPTMRTSGRSARTATAPPEIRPAAADGQHQRPHLRHVLERLQHDAGLPRHDHAGRRRGARRRGRARRAGGAPPRTRAAASRRCGSWSRRSARVATSLTSGAVSHVTTVASTPASAAAYATPCAWLPAETAITPRLRSSASSAAMRAIAPRGLNEPVFWNSSSLSRTSAPVISESHAVRHVGVRWSGEPAIRSRTRRMSSSVGGCTAGNPSDTRVASLRADRQTGRDQSHRCAARGGARGRWRGVVPARASGRGQERPARARARRSGGPGGRDRPRQRRRAAPPPRPRRRPPARARRRRRATRARRGRARRSCARAAAALPRRRPRPGRRPLAGADVRARLGPRRAAARAAGGAEHAAARRG